MRHKKFQLFRTLIFGICLTGCIYLYLSYSSSEHYKDFLPDKLETQGNPYVSTSGNSLWSLRGGGCGIAVFDLANAIHSEIKSQNIAFFANMNIATKSTGETVESYGKWVPTPLGSKFLSNGLPPGFGQNCSSEPTKGWFSQVLNEYQRPGNYVSFGAHGRSLIVIPDMKIVIFSFYN